MNTCRARCKLFGVYPMYDVVNNVGLVSGATRLMLECQTTVQRWRCFGWWFIVDASLFCFFGGVVLNRNTGMGGGVGRDCL